MKAVLIMDMPECCGKCKLMDEDYLLNRCCLAHSLDSINITDNKAESQTGVLLECYQRK